MPSQRLTKRTLDAFSVSFYFLGTAPPALIKKLNNRHKATTTWIGIDREKNMIEQAKCEVFSDNKKIKNLKLIIDDAITFNYKKSDFIISYYTIQFIPNRLRQILIDKIYSSLNWGGAFLIFEKVRGPDARFQDLMTGIYNEFMLAETPRALKKSRARNPIAHIRTKDTPNKKTGKYKPVMTPQGLNPLIIKHCLWFNRNFIDSIIS